MNDTKALFLPGGNTGRQDSPDKPVKQPDLTPAQRDHTISEISAHSSYLHEWIDYLAATSTGSDSEAFKALQVLQQQLDTLKNEVESAMNESYRKTEEALQKEEDEKNNYHMEQLMQLFKKRGPVIIMSPEEATRLKENIQVRDRSQNMCLDFREFEPLPGQYRQHYYIFVISENPIKQHVLYIWADRDIKTDKITRTLAESRNYNASLLPPYQEKEMSQPPSQQEVRFTKQSNLFLQLKGLEFAHVLDKRLSEEQKQEKHYNPALEETISVENPTLATRIFATFRINQAAAEKVRTSDDSSYVKFCHDGIHYAVVDLGNEYCLCKRTDITVAIDHNEVKRYAAESDKKKGPLPKASPHTVIDPKDMRCHEIDLTEFEDITKGKHVIQAGPESQAPTQALQPEKTKAPKKSGFFRGLFGDKSKK